MSDTMRGIDISNHNFEYLDNREYFDLRTADFVIMKASEGVHYKDPFLDRFYDVLHQSSDGRPDPDLCYGFYHYARPELGNSAIAEAEFFLHYVEHHAGCAIFALDVEGAALSMQKEYLDAWVRTWLDHVYDETGVKPLLYCSLSAVQRFPAAAAGDYGLWCASWGKRPNKTNIKPWKLCAIWQSGTGSLDKDTFFGNPDQWYKYCERC